MSHEFYQIMVGAPTISLYSWKQLARWSIEYSCLSDVEKLQGQEILESSWQRFSRGIVNDFKGLMKENLVDIDEDKARLAYEERKKKNVNEGLGRPTDNSKA